MPIRHANELVTQHLGGSNELIVSIRSADDNRFLEPVGRFPEIEEDVAPVRLLVGDYSRYYLHANSANQNGGD